MRKGTTLLPLAALAIAAIACLWVPDAGAIAAGLEPTDSGAPSAIVIFPVGGQPNPDAAAMAPVAFNHVIHEKWMAKAGKDCMVCHHTGDPVACTTCHTLEGKAEGGNVPLYRAMHTPKVNASGDYPPSSCVSCHERQLKLRNCAGCHETLVRDAREANSWCAVCHTITPKMTKTQFDQGIEDKLPFRQNEALAEETALARKQAKYWSPLTAPYKVTIDTLKGTYEPCVFNHRHHVISLMGRIQKNELAGAFHTEPGTLCVTCHHHSPPSATPPKCGSCHAIRINPENPGKPRLMAAFHLQCMNCHRDMQVARPRNSDCATCHKLRVENAENQEGRQ